MQLAMPTIPALPTTWPMVDIILLLALAGFVFYGLFFGLIKTVGSLLGVVAGALVASRVYILIFNWVKPLAFGHDNLGKIIVFAICFTLVDRLVCLGFALLNKTFHLFSMVPFLKTINRLGGAVFGFLEGGLVLGLMLYVISKYLPGGGWLIEQLKNSQMTPFLMKFGDILVPLLPEVLRRLNSLF